MIDIESEFFQGKRPWSKLKDQVLEKYLSPYLKKVKRLNKTVILVDSFAGPGTYENDGSIGSPLIMCNIANEIIKDNFIVLLANKNKFHHDQLSNLLQQFIVDKKAFTIWGKAENLLLKLNEIITDQTLFIYLDPFGLKGTDFELLKTYLLRDQRHSTEILINLSIPTILRYSCINTYQRTGLTPMIATKHKIISNALGGDYWKDFLLDDTLSADERRQLIIERYREKLKSFLPYVGYCPIHESDESSTMKYAIFFASRHPDAMKLMNNIMLSAYSKHIWNAEFKDTLFESIDWEDNLPPEYYTDLENNILEIISIFTKISRKDLFIKLIQLRFMKFLEKHFNQKISELCNRQVLDYIDVRKTKKLNEDSILFIKKNG